MKRPRPTPEEKRIEELEKSIESNQGYVDRNPHVENRSMVIGIIENQKAELARLKGELNART